MAINVDTVYKTVLLILNKEQRGYMTPDEFNKVATQVQLETFENYFESLNQQLRVPDNDNEYADRVKNIDEKIAVFKTSGVAIYDTTRFKTPVNSGLISYIQEFITLPSVSVYGFNNISVPQLQNSIITVSYDGVKKVEGVDYSISGNLFTYLSSGSPASPPVGVNINVIANPSDFYRLGTVIYNDEIEVQKVERNELLYINSSPLTKPTDKYPLYVYEDYNIYVYPKTITSGISVTYVRKPKDVVWNFTIPSGENFYQFNAVNSSDFELHVSEQAEVILKILLYAGVVVKDYNLVNLASQQVQAEQLNQKS